MTTETFVVAYEGGDGDTSLLDYAIERAKKDGAKLVLVHILEWSPYSFLTPQELEERKARRMEELDRAKSKLLDPAMEKVKAAGLEVDSWLKFGSVVELICEAATKESATMIFVGRAGSQSMAARVFGSVPIGLAQVAPVPTVIVP